MATAWNARNILLILASRNGRQTSLLERRALKTLTRLYQSASHEIVGILESRQMALLAQGLSPEEVLAALARDRGLLLQIEARLAELNGSVQGALRTTVLDAKALARELGRAETAAMGRGLGTKALDLAFGMVDWGSIEVGLPRALAELATANEALARLLLTQLRGGLLRGESFPDLVKRILDADTGLLARGKTSAMLGARRNVIHANNASRDALYQHLGQDVPGLMKQAVAAISDRTTRCCLRVHGQIQPLNKPYKLEADPHFARELPYPPFHWNCRTTSVAYHPDFERGAKLTTGDMKAAAQAELGRRAKGESEEIRPEHSTSGR